MFVDSKEFRLLRKKYHHIMKKSGIKTFQDIGRIELEALKSGALLQKHKELIALGISIAKGCYG